MKKSNVDLEEDSVFFENIKRGIEKGYISLENDWSRITYHCSRDYSTSFKNPEEKIRASYFVELILDYKYPKNKIDIEVTVPRRTPEDRADIVIYEDEELKTPYLIVECKKDGITDSEFNQAIEQAFGNANSLRGKYAIVVAGNTKTAFDVAGFKPSEREKNVIADIPTKFGKAPKYKFIKGEEDKELKTVSREELIKTLKKCHDTIWQGGKLNPTTAFDEVAKLLFCKIKDEKDWTMLGEHYDFQIGTHETADEVYNRIDSIYQAAKKEDAEVFKQDINLPSKIVYKVVEHLQSLAINKIDLDTKGIAFEHFMQDLFKGKMGQYFTPRNIVQFCVKMFDSDICNLSENPLILDPACGSGGFLLNALDSVRNFVENNYNSSESSDYWHKFAMNNLYGIEINDQIARISKMNMIIHDDGHTNVINTDALSREKEITKIHDEFTDENFDLILTNPPFGAKVDNAEKDYLHDYDLGEGKKRQKTEVIFIERCFDFLKPGNGKMGIVLPEGILTNTSLQYVRDYILNHFKILAVVSLPEHTFSHYGTGVKSSLLFLRKKGKGEVLQDYELFMAEPEHIGYDSTGREDRNELYSEKGIMDDTVLTEWKKFKRDKSSYSGTDKCFSVNIEKVKNEGPLNPRRYIWEPDFGKETSTITDIAEVKYDSIKPTKKKYEEKKFALIRMDKLSNDPVAIDDIQYGSGEDFNGRYQIVKKDDVLLSRLGPSMLNKKILVCPEVKDVDYIIASTEFIVIRPFDKNDSHYIAGIYRTDTMLKYLYSKCRGGTPSRYRLSRDDIKILNFPIPDKERRESLSKKFEQALKDYQEMIRRAENNLERAHKDMESTLWRGE